MGMGTELIHGHGYSDGYDPIAVPIHLSTAFRFIDESECRTSDRGYPYKYSREENPTVRAFERAMGRVEGGQCLAYCSGMAAISSVLLALIHEGARRVVVLEEMYSTTLQLVDRLREITRIDVVKVFPSTEAVVEVVREGDVVLVESVTNPTLKVIDVSAIARACRDLGATLVVDNTIATPVLLKPLELGATVVVHSATKYIAGHNDALGGVASFNPSLLDPLWNWRRILGSIMDPFSAYLCLRGLKTLGVRFERQCRSAQIVAEFLQDHPRVEEVLYPGLPSYPSYEVAKRIFRRDLFGAIVSFRVRGGLEDAKRFLRRLRIVKPAPSFGGCESLATIPALSASRWIDAESRRRLGITENLVRLSIGLEDPEDLVEDIDRALGE